MAYNYFRVFTRRIHKNGNFIGLTDQTSIATPFETSIGDRIEFNIILNATGGDDFYNKTIYFNPKFYAAGSLQTTPVLTEGYIAVTDGTNGMFEFQLSGVYTQNAENLKGRIEVTTATDATIYFEFLVTHDLGTYVPEFSFNILRLLATKQTQGAYMKDISPTVYNANFPNAMYHILTTIRENTNLTALYATVTDTGGEDTLKRLFHARWYGRNFGSLDWDYRINTFTNTVNSNVIASKTFNSPVYDVNYDNNFFYEGDLLSFTEDNLLEFNISGNTAVGATPASIDQVKAILIKESNITNSVNFEDDYDLKSSQIISNPGGSSQLDGAIYEPTEFIPTPNLGAFVQVTIKGSELEYNEDYRVILVLYDTPQETSFSVISHRLTASHIPECVPDIDLFFSNYFDETECAAAIFSYHERVCSRLEIDYSTYDTCIQALGFNTNFLDALVFASLEIGFVGNGNPVAPTGNPELADFELVFAYRRPENQIVVNRNGTGLFAIDEGSTMIDTQYCFRLDEQIDTFSNPATGNIYPIRWRFMLEIPVPGGSKQRVDIDVYKKISIRNWESVPGHTSPPPELLEMAVYDFDTYPTTLDPVINLCNEEKLLIEVTKINGLSGLNDVPLITTFYRETLSYGITANELIREHSNYAPGALLAQLRQTPLLNVPADFAASDIATFCVDVDGMDEGNQYFVDAIVKDITP